LHQTRIEIVESECPLRRPIWCPYFKLYI